MNVLYLLVPLALLLAGAGVLGFRWAVRSGQYDDVETPAIRVLLDDDPAGGDGSNARAPGASSRP